MVLQHVSRSQTDQKVTISVVKIKYNEETRNEIQLRERTLRHSTWIFLHHSQPLSRQSLACCVGCCHHLQPTISTNSRTLNTTTTVTNHLSEAQSHTMNWSMSHTWPHDRKSIRIIMMIRHCKLCSWSLAPPVVHAGIGPLDLFRSALIKPNLETTGWLWLHQFKSGPYRFNSHNHTFLSFSNNEGTSALLWFRPPMGWSDLLYIDPSTCFRILPSSSWVVLASSERRSYIRCTIIDPSFYYRISSSSSWNLV